jgi:hypothetical protein
LTENLIVSSRGQRIYRQYPVAPAAQLAETLHSLIHILPVLLTGYRTIAKFRSDHCNAVNVLFALARKGCEQQMAVTSASMRSAIVHVSVEEYRQLLAPIDGLCACHHGSA